MNSVNLSFREITLYQFFWIIEHPLLQRITLDQHKYEKNNRIIQLIDVFVYIMGPRFFDYNKRLILLLVIQLSGGHCNLLFYRNKTVNRNKMKQNFEFSLKDKIKRNLQFFYTLPLWCVIFDSSQKCFTRFPFPCLLFVNT